MAEADNQVTTLMEGFWEGVWEVDAVTGSTVVLMDSSRESSVRRQNRGMQKCLPYTAKMPKNWDHQCHY